MHQDKNFSCVSIPQDEWDAIFKPDIGSTHPAARKDKRQIDLEDYIESIDEARRLEALAALEIIDKKLKVLEANQKLVMDAIGHERDAADEIVEKRRKELKKKIDWGVI